ncbi:MAG: flagellar protein FliS [Anaerolineales bacterium]|nr:flagellar protein FliS [Anaerolineales bacterium]
MYNAYRMQEYRQQEVMGASPLRLVVLTYDVAIQACEQKDNARAYKAISLLRDSLNFDYPEVSIGLFRLYQWCLDCIRQGDFAEASKTLRGLREAWNTVEKRQSQAQATQVPAPAELARPAALAQAAY